MNNKVYIYNEESKVLLIDKKNINNYDMIKEWKLFNGNFSLLPDGTKLKHDGYGIGEIKNKTNTNKTTVLVKFSSDLVTLPKDTKSLSFLVNKESKIKSKNNYLELDKFGDGMEKDTITDQNPKSDNRYPNNRYTEEIALLLNENMRVNKLYNRNVEYIKKIKDQPKNNNEIILKAKLDVLQETLIKTIVKGNNLKM